MSYTAAERRVDIGKMGRQTGEASGNDAMSRCSGLHDLVPLT